MIVFHTIRTENQLMYLTIEDPEVNRIILDQLNSPKSYIQRKSRNTRRNTRHKPEYTIAEYNQRCEDAREELIAPLRQEAVHSCMKMKHSMTRRYSRSL